ncbi:PhzF family phenazine biosynthesis protein [Lutibacter sp.]|uniref:PhzF family phenazine biosynthesis protein n=1 Tax=Lutibacter sp. TaxID=1925666 RepID=UPI0027371FF4|nr:PhzF family phenazine biosynthesis protein [Lutibacter sp.]MDP3312886.1 PhzF family phenazine biosynthesis protein [Lutibacter sp.]
MIIYQVDAFTNQLFKGNPAAVCPLDSWIPDTLMQSIAEENNLSETVFFVKNKENFDIKWFTPTCEVNLCGHATLAAAHILFTELNYTQKVISFHSKRGILTVKKNIDWYTLNFPSDAVVEIKIPKILEEALQIPILKCFKSDLKLLVEVESEELINQLNPNYNLLLQLEENDIIVTSKGNSVDFVSRFFAPKIGINEDPVTGSAHSMLIPFWASKLNKDHLEALQLSKRTGYLKCTNLEGRVEMSGQAITYLKGKLNL